MEIAEDSLDWHDALDSYSYPVDFRRFSGRDRFPDWFDRNLEKGDRSQTIEFETRFRKRAASRLESWYEVVFWKMYSQRGRANFQTKRTIERIENGTSANTLWKCCTQYRQTETKKSFRQFQHLLIEERSIAVAFTFAAFSDPSRFPMVDKRTAQYVASEATRLEFSTAPEIDKTLKRYRVSGGGVLTLSDWPFIEEWVTWCRKMADQLSAHKKRAWRARDVEMAVFRAWGERKERKSCSKVMPRYRLIDKLAQGRGASGSPNAQT
jgi:hypothetical protein